MNDNKLNTKAFPMLYKRNSKGNKILTWSVQIIELSEREAKVVTTTGDLSGSGKDKISEKIIESNNRHCSFDRAVSLLTTQWEKKVRLGYFDTKEASEASEPLRTAMLASTLSPEGIESIPHDRFPLYMQVKKNGLRCTYHRGIDQLKSRELKDFDKLPNLKLMLKEVADSCCLDYIDLELYASGYPINKQVSMVRRGSDKVQAYIFDIPDTDGATATARFNLMSLKVNTVVRYLPLVNTVPTFIGKHTADVRKFYEEAIRSGEEGIILRSTSGVYKWDNKNSRGTELVKVKPLLSEEFTIIGIGCESRVIDGEKVELIDFLCSTLDGDDTFKVTPASFGVKLRKKMYTAFRRGTLTVECLPPLSLTFREWTTKNKPFHIKESYLRYEL